VIEEVNKATKGKASTCCLKQRRRDLLSVETLAEFMLLLRTSVWNFD